MKDKILIAMITTLLALFIGVSVVSAQDELTLEILAERFDVFREVVFELAERVEAMDTLLTPSPVMDEEGNCRLATRERMHIMSMASYLEKYADSDAPDRINVENVYFLTENTIGITIRVDARPNDRLVTEYYNGCEFLGVSKWWSVDYSGERIDE